MASHVMLWKQGSTNHSIRCCVEWEAPSKKNKPQNQLPHLQSESRGKRPIVRKIPYLKPLSKLGPRGE
jgi:hypothetical protein